MSSPRISFKGPTTRPAPSFSRRGRTFWASSLASSQRPSLAQAREGGHGEGPGGERVVWEGESLFRQSQARPPLGGGRAWRDGRRGRPGLRSRASRGTPSSFRRIPSPLGF
jgi:hypothetical protein